MCCWEHPIAFGCWRWARERLGGAQGHPKGTGRRGREEQGRLVLPWSCQPPGAREGALCLYPHREREINKKIYNLAPKRSFPKPAWASPEPGKPRRVGLLIPSCWGARGTSRGRPVRPGGPRWVTGHPYVSVRIRRPHVGPSDLLMLRTGSVCPPPPPVPRGRFLSGAGIGKLWGSLLVCARCGRPAHSWGGTGAAAPLPLEPSEDVWPLGVGVGAGMGIPAVS